MAIGGQDWLTEFHRSTKRDTALGSRSPCLQSERTEVPPRQVRPQPQWREAADRLRRACVLECDHIAAELAHGDRVVAESQPVAQWLPGAMSWRYDEP